MEGMGYLHMIEEEDPLVDVTHRSNKSKDMTLTKDDKNLTQRSIPMVNTEDEFMFSQRDDFLFDNLSQMHELQNTNRKDAQAQGVQTEPMEFFMDS